MPHVLHFHAHRLEASVQQLEAETAEAKQATQQVISTMLSRTLHFRVTGDFVCVCVCVCVCVYVCVCVCV